jgi:hypothetical protein
MDITGCPECGAPAEITDRCVLVSTSGLLEHVRVECVNRHWFLMPAATLARSHRRHPTAPQIAAATPPPDRGTVAP